MFGPAYALLLFCTLHDPEGLQLPDIRLHKIACPLITTFPVEQHDF